MAKAKKSATPISEAPVSETPKKPAVKAKPAAKSAAKSAAKPAAKPVAKAAAPAAPMVNTSLAAETAARMIGAKAGGFNSASSGPRKETSAFKQMKQSFTKPHAAGIGNMLNSTISPAAKKSNQPFHAGKQVGHNQTMGSEATRTSVPRRTGG